MSQDRLSFADRLHAMRIRDVPPGGTFEPYHGAAGYPLFTAHQIKPYTFLVPGSYRIRFFYSTASEDIAEWVGNESKNLAELLRLVPKVDVASDEVVVEVVGQERR